MFIFFKSPTPSNPEKSPKRTRTWPGNHIIIRVAFWGWLLGKGTYNMKNFVTTTSMNNIWDVPPYSNKSLTGIKIRGGGVL